MISLAQRNIRHHLYPCGQLPIGIGSREDNVENQQAMITERIRGNVGAGGYNGRNMNTIGERVRALREKYGMTAQEVADIGGLNSASEVSKVENSHNLASTEHLLVGLANGFGLTLEEFFSFKGGNMTVDRAYSLGYPRIATKLSLLRRFTPVILAEFRELRKRIDPSSLAELDEAIEQAGVDPASAVFAMRIATDGLRQSVKKWIETLKSLDALRKRMASGKLVLVD